MRHTVMFFGGPRDEEVEEMEDPPYAFLVPIFTDTNRVHPEPMIDSAGYAMEDIYAVRYTRHFDRDNDRYLYIYESNERWDSRNRDIAYQTHQARLLALTREIFGPDTLIVGGYFPTGGSADSFSMKFGPPRENKSHTPTDADIEIEEWNKILHPERYK